MKRHLFPDSAMRFPVLMMFLTRLLIAVTVAVGLAGRADAQLFETRAGQALLLDADTGTVLFAKNADQKVPPASLAKLMTMEVVFNALKAGRLTMDDEFLVSENAWHKGGAGSGGSTMFAELGSSIRLEDLIQGVIIQSANDGCIVIAEGMAGSEEVFASLMNARAEKIGLDNSHFTNSTGLPDPAQFMTMRDLVKLADHIRREYPEYYKYYAQTEFTWNKILQRNRNPLLAMNIGADGMKTGYTEESGYAIVGSIQRDGRRLVVAMSGLPDMRSRGEEARKLLEWGTRAFRPFVMFKKDEIVGDVRLYGGNQLTVPVTGDGDLSILLPITDLDKIKARIVYMGPVAAPVEKGQKIAELKIWIGDELSQEKPLYAAESVPLGPIHRRALDALTELVLGWI